MTEAAITREYVVERIEDWENRIKSLFDDIREWAKQRLEWILDESSVTQRTEQMMKEHGVAPKPFPTLNFYNKKFRVGFVPSALWIVGADGRINVITNDKIYLLVDRRISRNEPSNWQITTPPERPDTKPFTKDVFWEILDQNK